MELADNSSIVVDIASENEVIDVQACSMDDTNIQYDSTISVSAAKTPKTSTASATALKYAPVMPTKRGTYDIYPISLSWTNDKGASQSQLRYMGNDIVSTYSRLSDGAIKFNMKGAFIQNTGLPKSANAVKSESNKAKAKFTDRSSPYTGFYAIVNNRAKKVSHAGNKTASLLTPLLTTARHEVGHLLGLKHANRYATVKGKQEFQSSRDGSSFMSIYSSNNLTAPQMYAMGWYKEQQVAMYEIGDPTSEFDLQPVCDKANSKYLNAVYIPKKAGTPVFLSMFEKDKDRLLALHVGEKGGSTRLQAFKGHAETDDLSIDLISEQADYWRVKVSSKGSVSK